MLDSVVGLSPFLSLLSRWSGASFAVFLTLGVLGLLLIRMTEEPSAARLVLAFWHHLVALVSCALRHGCPVRRPALHAVPCPRALAPLHHPSAEAAAEHLRADAATNTGTDTAPALPCLSDLAQVLAHGSQDPLPSCTARVERAYVAGICARLAYTGTTSRVHPTPSLASSVGVGLCRPPWKRYVVLRTACRTDTLRILRAWPECKRLVCRPGTSVVSDAAIFHRFDFQAEVEAYLLGARLYDRFRRADLQNV